MEKYQKLQNENSKVTTNREKPSLREEKLLMITAEMELKVMKVQLVVLRINCLFFFYFTSANMIVTVLINFINIICFLMYLLILG